MRSSSTDPLVRIREAAKRLCNESDSIIEWGLVLTRLNRVLEKEAEYRECNRPIEPTSLVLIT